MASRAPYASEHDQRDHNGDGKRDGKHPLWNPCHTLQGERRQQRGEEQGHNHAPKDSVLQIKVFAHRFHGARFYSLWSAAQ
jgi:hypothetical protein